MSNMSYCRFQNTLSDLVDCQDTLEEMMATECKPLSRQELHAAKELASRCLSIVEMLADHGGRDVDEDLNSRHLDDIIEEINDSCDEGEDDEDEED